MTIVATCVENIIVRDRARAPLKGRYRPIFLLAADWAIRRIRASIAAPSALRLRVVMVSTIVMVIATRWAIERNPW